ncbi:MAG TPA: outer membrane protein assembly factor BamD [Polyangiaceae bacterium]|jgi:hypothetical protein
MSDLKLVAPDQPTPLEKLLMNAVSNEHPSADQRARVRLALGLAPIVAVPAAIQPALKSSWRVFAKVAVGGAAVAGAVAAVLFVRAPHVPTPLPVTPTHVATPPVVAAPEPVPAPLAADPAPPVIQADDLAAEPSADKAPAAARGASAKAEDPDLAGQILLIEQARKAISSGNAVSASQALDSYAVQYPRGSFGQEASVLRIEAIDLRGDHAQATQLARAFLTRYPKSPHVSVMQRIADR